MAPTTVKASSETRDRLRSFGGATLDETINDALDALEAAEFWRRAEAYVSWRQSLSAESRRVLATREAELDAVVDALW